MTRNLIKQALIAQLVESIAIIRGNAQLASVIDHPKWNAKYIRAIIDEIDITHTLIQKVAEMCDDKSQDTEDYFEEAKRLYH